MGKARTHMARRKMGSARKRRSEAEIIGLPPMACLRPVQVCGETDDYIGVHGVHDALGEHSGAREHGSNGSAASRSAAISTSTKPHFEHKAMVPSFRLKEEAEKRRLLQAENAALKARISELERVIKAGRLREARQHDGNMMPIR
jgi:hypothetical protein